ncbi:MAG: multifunctional CCA addition/repair protein [Gammaproteobacteria bacterium]|nr:multifunctional CCA addition/repair protein [Gammaproteobacteria bacterium]MDH5628611.1 multifunctional CCA addition/repair protein [Gammaproteobacteria bacterium]
MQIYLVGGAVRDKYLEYPVREKDWVVVGSSADDLLSQGYKQVGKGFPVFLHPETHEEYALARTEKKSGQGYYGFDIYTGKEVTLEEDLARRDLTINAMALDNKENLIDPCNGLNDLKKKVLRHISPSFAEDPLRVLRVARFAARYHHLGFSIAKETLSLMKSLVDSGELKTLPAERVWLETEKALTEKSPQIYFEVLRQCNALKYWFEEIDCLWGVPNPPRWHPEIDTGIHTMMVLEQAAKITDDPVTRFAALCHDLGKGATPAHILPSHPGHEKRGIPIIVKLCKRLTTPRHYEKLATLCSEYHLHLHRIEELRANTIVKVLEATRAFHNPAMLEKFVQVCEADFKGRTGFENRPYPQATIIKQAYHACQSLDVQDLIAQGFNGSQLGEELHRQRVNLVKQLTNK